MTNVETKLQNFFNKIHQDLINVIIYKVDDEYILYDQYSIKNVDDYYVVMRYRDQKKYKFNHLKNATVWTILDKNNKFYEANRVLELDTKIESIKVDRTIHNKLRKTSNLESHLIYTDKYENDILRHRVFQKELDKYIIMANFCQQRGFENELNRTSGKQKE